MFKGKEASGEESEEIQREMKMNETKDRLRFAMGVEAERRTKGMAMRVK